jgi:hypothetical protein
LGPVGSPDPSDTYLSPAKVPSGPFRSIETFASPLHCAPSSQVSLIAETPNTRVSATRRAFRLTRCCRAWLARFCMWLALLTPSQLMLFEELSKPRNCGPGPPEVLKLPAVQQVPRKARATASLCSDASGLSPAKVSSGPFRSIETFASPLHCAPSSQVSLIAETPNTRVSAYQIYYGSLIPYSP